MSTVASNNPFPSVLFTEGTEPAAPASGKQRLYIDSTTHHASRTDSSGNQVDLEAVQQSVTADPSPLANGMVWYFDDGGSPASLSIRWRKGGVTYEFPIGTATT